MQGYPKSLNSWEDVEYVVDNFPKEQWKEDLEGLIRDDVINMWAFEKELGENEAGETNAKHKVIDNEGTGETVEVTNPETGEVTYEQKKVRYQYKLVPCMTCRLALFKNCQTEKDLAKAVKEVQAMLKKQA